MKCSLILAATVLFACSGSGGSGSSPAPKLRPANSPDILVVSVSGRCGVNCWSPDTNQPYLGDAGDAREAVEDTFRRLGNTTDHADFISSFYSFDDNNNGEADRHGFMSLVDVLFWVFENWMRGFDNPTRIVIVAHSHGCVWAHMATSVVPYIPIDYLISLDGNCFKWESDYTPDITYYFTRHGNPFSWDIRNACDSWRIPGIRALQDTEDVVFPSVAVNLEVRSADPWLFRDLQPNHRTDGSRTGILTYDATFDDHSGVHHPNGESMSWVRQQLRNLER